MGRALGLRVNVFNIQDIGFMGLRFRVQVSGIRAYGFKADGLAFRGHGR